MDDSRISLPEHVPAIVSWEVFVSAMTFGWLRYSTKKKSGITVNLFVEQQQQFALIWALLLSVVSAGLFSMQDWDFAHSEHAGPFLRTLSHLSGFFFCSAEIALIFAVFGCLLLMLAARSTPTDHEFHALHKLLGERLPSLPMAMGVYGVLAAFFGLIAYFGMVYSEMYTLCCLGVCATSFPVMWWALMTLTRAVVATHGHVSQHRQPTVRNAEEIYAQLQEYNMSCRTLNDLKRTVFLERIGCVDETTALGILARKVYDDWLSKKLNRMLKADPGF